LKTGDLIVSLNGTSLGPNTGKDAFFFMLLDAPRPLVLSVRHRISQRARAV
jgi:hypothetical protein